MQTKDKFVYVVITHATMIEFFHLLTENVREKTNYCSINIYQNELCEDRYNFNQLSCRKSVLEKNYYGYQAKKQWEESQKKKVAGVTGFFNKVFCSF